MTYTLTAWRDHKFSFVWGLDSLAQAQRQGVRYLRKGRGRTVQVCKGDRVIWARGVTKSHSPIRMRNKEIG